MKDTLIRLFSLILCLISICIKVNSQSSFQVLFQSSNDKTSSFDLEDNLGNFITTGSEVDPSDSIWKNKLWKISAYGDTSSYRIDLNEVRSYFSYIENISDSTYLLFGASGDTLHRLSYNLLTVVLTDTVFNVQWVKTFDIKDERNLELISVLKDDYGYYIIGNIVDENIPGIYNPLFIRLNNVGDTIRTSITPGFDGNEPVHSAIFNPDSTSIWWFSSSPPSQWGRLTRRTVDTMFNFLGQDTLMYKISGEMCAKHISDSSFLFSCTYHINEAGQPDDDEIGVFLFNNNLEALEFNHFGAVDTLDYPGRAQGIDFRNADTLYYAGMKNVIISFNPDGPSWILVGQLDATLQPRYQRIYGGDGYYMVLNVLATRDGGCMISTLLHDHELNKDDLLIMKLDPEGLITRTEDLIVPFRNAIVYPNPVRSLLCVEFTNQKGIFSLIDLNGRIVKQAMIHKGRNDVDISNLSAGFFIYRIQINNQEFESGKIIKL
jgi:hypothetical protein